MRFNASEKSDLYDEVGKALGGADGIAEVGALLEDVGMTLGLRNHGVDSNDVGQLPLKRSRTRHTRLIRGSR